jgi:hypothetical protein
VVLILQRRRGLLLELQQAPERGLRHHKKSGAEHSDPTPQFKSYGLSGGCAKPIFDHAHEKSAKRQGEWGLMLQTPWVEVKLASHSPLEEAGFERSSRSARAENVRRRMAEAQPERRADG